MRQIKQVLFRFIVLLVFLGVASALAQAVTPTVQLRYDAVVGHYLTGPNGMTLYVFTNDTEDTSNCYEQCAQNWPPLLVEGDSVHSAPLSLPGTFAVTERSDGSKQVTYNGWPLYYWARDTAVGDTNGQGVGNVWYVANLNPVIQLLHHPEHGDILVGPTGMTLYLFSNDETNKSNCYEGCAFRWPPLVGGFEPTMGVMPLTAESLTGKLEMLARDDGGHQLSYNGQPLYYWMNDHKPGDATGHNVGGVWSVVKP